MSNLQRNKAPLLLLLALMLLASTSFRAMACSNITYNGGENWFPYFYRHKNVGKGIVNDILQRAAIDINLTYSLDSAKPWKRQLLELKAGRIDFLAGTVKNEQRESYFSFSSVIAQAKLSIFTRADSPINFEKLSDLTNLRGIKLLGMSLGSEVDDYAFDNLVIDETLTIRSMFKMIEVGRVDYGIIYNSTGQRYLKEHKLSDAIAAEVQPLTVIDIHIAATKESQCPENIEQIFVEINRMKQDGRIIEIEKIYREGEA